MYSPELRAKWKDISRWQSHEQRSKAFDSWMRDYMKEQQEEQMPEPEPNALEEMFGAETLERLNLEKL